MKFPVRLARASGAVVVVLALVPAVGADALHAAQGRPHPGASGVGDPYFPREGNGGYDARHYQLNLRYDPSARVLAGTVTMTARATADLDRFDLDLSGMTVRSVQVDGRDARVARVGQELRVTPTAALPSGSVFRTAVRYDGSPKTIIGSPIVFGAPYGWQYTKDGTFVGDEPNAARTWFPCSDHPSDKARFTFHVTVPDTRQVVANGNLKTHYRHDGLATYVYRETSPMATYLATVDVGRWRFVHGRTPDGIRELVAMDPSAGGRRTEHHVFALTGRITDFWAKKFGPYPFTSTGAIVDHVPHVGFSLETQTRPLYGFVPDPITMSHELSHQWFGDSVSVADWHDIWLNEGFATFAMRLWAEHTGGATTYRYFRRQFTSIPAHNAFWHQKVARPGRDTMFSSAVYFRGAMTLAALRHRLHDRVFFTLLQRWTATHRYANGTTAQFVRLADAVSGQRLGHFFHVWLYTERKPSSFTVR